MVLTLTEFVLVILLVHFLERARIFGPCVAIELDTRATFGQASLDTTRTESEWEIKPAARNVVIRRDIKYMVPVAWDAWQPTSTWGSAG